MTITRDLVKIQNEVKEKVIGRKYTQSIFYL